MYVEEPDIHVNITKEIQRLLKN